MVVSGGPDLGDGGMAQRRDRFRDVHDAWRRAIVNEPRGSDVLVGALLCAPVDAASTCGVIFFNNVGYIGMCGHGTIGLVATLAYLGRAKPGEHRIETPVGIVTATLACRRRGDGRPTSRPTATRRRCAWTSRVTVPCTATWRGAATGSSCAAIMACRSKRSRVGELAAFASRVREALRQQGVTGLAGAEIDHIELFGPPADPRNDARNFVLCPGGAYDRSPCGTGTSAKLACLAADGKLAPGAPWRQESVIGSVFTGRYASPAAPLPGCARERHPAADPRPRVRHA